MSPPRAVAAAAEAVAAMEGTPRTNDMIDHNSQLQFKYYVVKLHGPEKPYSLGHSEVMIHFQNGRYASPSGTTLKMKINIPYPIVIPGCI